MYTFSQLFNVLCILYDYLYIFCYEFMIWRWRVLIEQISHYLQVLWLSHFKVLMCLYNNTLTGTLTTEMGNMNLSKLLCTHCLNSLLKCAFCMIICIYIFFEYMIWRWRVLTDQNISLLASLVTFSFQWVAGSWK